MNYHSDEWIVENLNRHYEEALKRYKADQIVLVALQGSQNYGLDTPDSDIDTKLIIVPTFKDIAFNKKPISTTHVLDNNEHLDAKDIRLYMETFRKQNLNFLEILFTPYKIINPMYAKQWARLETERENIARMNKNRAVASMKGVAEEKFHAMEHPYPSKLEILAKYGYDLKQLHHLLRVERYLEEYICGVPYSLCLTPSKDFADKLIKIKTEPLSLELARALAQHSMDNIEEMASAYRMEHPEKEDSEMRVLLEDIQYNIMKIAVKHELTIM